MSALAMPLVLTVPVQSRRAGVTAPPRPAMHPSVSHVAASPDHRAYEAGFSAANKRFAAVLASPASASNLPLAAHLIIQTKMSAGEIITTLRQVSADAAAAPAARQAATVDRWASAFQRAQTASTDDAPRPPQSIINRWDAAMRRARVIG